MNTAKNNMIFAFLFILSFPMLCMADITHYINSNVGDRASGLAGAYTAISDDSSGCYYNPAGIALAPSNKFSASVNAVGTSTKIYKGVLENEAGGTQDWEQKSFTLLPNYFGIVQKFGAGMLGFSYAVPDSTEMRQKQTFSDIRAYDTSGNPFIITSYSIDINEYDKAYLFGPSYSYQVSGSISVGMTLYYFYRDFERIYNQYIELETGSEAIYNIHDTQVQQGLKPILGVIWDPVDNLSLGLAVSRLWLFDSETERQFIYNEGSFFTRQWTDSSEKDTFPLTIAIGVAWFYSPSLLFSWDTKYYDDIDDKKRVLNIAVATEYYPTDAFAVRGGFYTDMSNAPDVTTSVSSDFDQIDIYGICLSGTFFSGKSSISLGLDLSFGSGDSQANASNNNVYDVDYTNLTLHVSTSFTY